jgi:hypothetical protein
VHPWSGPFVSRGRDLPWLVVCVAVAWAVGHSIRTDVVPGRHHVVIRYEGLSSDDELWVPARVVVALTMAPLAWRKVSRGPAVGTGR